MGYPYSEAVIYWGYPLEQGLDYLPQCREWRERIARAYIKDFTPKAKTKNSLLSEAISHFGCRVARGGYMKDALFDQETVYIALNKSILKAESGDSEPLALPEIDPIKDKQIIHEFARRVGLPLLKPAWYYTSRWYDQ